MSPPTSGTSRDKFNWRPTAVALTVVTTFACDQVPTAPETLPPQAATISSAQSPDRPDLFAVARYSLDLSVSGSLKPGGAPRIEYRVTAHQASPDTRIIIRFPEIEAAEANNWEPGLPKPGPVAAAVNARARLATNEQTAGGVSVQVPVAGYYRVVLTAVDPTAPPTTSSGQHIQNTAHLERWLLIDENGGRVTPTFDRSALPDTVVGQPGPRAIRKKSRAGGGAQEGVVSTMSSFTVSGNYMYYNYDTGAYVPISGVRVSLAIYDAYTNQLLMESPQYATTGVDGYWEGECPSNDYDRHDFGFYLENGAVTTNGGGYTSVSVYSNDCGRTDVFVSPQSNYGHVFHTLNRIVGLSESMFQRSRGGIYVQLGSFSNSSYSKDYPWGPTSHPDRIRIKSDSPDHVWGSWGKFVMSHEYGHAFHHRALGDFLDDLGSGCEYHTFSSVEAPRCAHVEGYADFHAVATLGDETGYRSSIEANSYYPAGQDGHHIEGAVAAFLYDLADPANEAHDALSGTARYVGDLIATCRVERGAGWYQNFEGSHIVYCAEDQIDPWVRSNYFLGTEFPPYTHLEGAGEPAGWSVGIVRAIWLRNLYGQ